MAKAFTIQTNFLGGEIDPLLKGRVDIPRYQHGLKTLTNAHVLPTGGAARRSGTRFVYNAGVSITVKLIPFVIFRKDVTPSVIQGYVIEFRSDNKIRFYTNGALVLSGGNPYEITNPFTNANLKKIRYERFNNILYLVHPDFPPQQLVRTNDTSWAISAVSFTQPATPHWDASSGYPTTIAFFEQRMILGSTKAEPQTIWGSQSGNILNLVTGVNDSDPFEFTLSVATSNILHLTTGNQIIVHTYDKEITMKGGLEKALTPTNVQIKEQTTYGIKEGVRPLTVNGELLFATQHGTKIRTLAYQVDKDAYTAPDISLVAGHLIEAGVEEMAKTQEPFNLIWIITTDGNLILLAVDREQEIIAWSKNTTDGLFKSIMAIPYNNTDQVWVAVERRINGVTKTYIEYFDPALNTDCAITASDALGKKAWTGLGHLEGKLVNIVADGAALVQ